MICGIQLSNRPSVVQSADKLIAWVKNPNNDLNTVLRSFSMRGKEETVMNDLAHLYSLAYRPPDGTTNRTDSDLKLEQQYQKVALEVMLVLIERGASFSQELPKPSKSYYRYRYNQDLTPLSTIVDTRHPMTLDLVTKILEQTPTQASCSDSQALYYAHYMPELIRLLVKHGASVKTKAAVMGLECEISHFKTRNYTYDVVDTYLDLGTSPNSVEIVKSLGSQKSVDLVKHFVEKGFNLKKYGASLANYVLMTGKKDFFAELVRDLDLVNVLKPTSTLLGTLLKFNQHDLVAKLVVKMPHSQCRSLVELACKEGSWETVQAVIGSGMQPTCRMISLALNCMQARCLEILLTNDEGCNMLSKIDLKQLDTFARRLPTGSFLDKIHAYIIAHELEG